MNERKAVRKIEYTETGMVISVRGWATSQWREAVRVDGPTLRTGVVYLDDRGKEVAG